MKVRRPSVCSGEVKAQRRWGGRVGGGGSVWVKKKGVGVGEGRDQPHVHQDPCGKRGSHIGKRKLGGEGSPNYKWSVLSYGNSGEKKEAS